MVPISKFLFKEGSREFYIDNLKRVLKELKEGTITFEIEVKDDPDNPAYCWRFGNNIHLRPQFFKEFDKAIIIAHELGRRYPRITGDSGLDNLNNIMNWRAIIRLSDDYERLKAMR